MNEEICCITNKGKIYKNEWKNDDSGKIRTILFHIYWLTCLILIWVGSLGVRFEVWGGETTPCLKLVRIMLETLNLARKYTHIYFQKIYPLVRRPS